MKIIQGGGRRNDIHIWLLISIVEVEFKFRLGKVENLEILERTLNILPPSFPYLGGLVIY